MKPLTIALACFVATGITCAAADSPSLKDSFRSDFLIGAALNSSQFSSTAAENPETALVEHQFNSITPENVLKWESVHPEPNRYNFAPGDRYVEFGLRNHMFIIGHNLIWHNQTPRWVFLDANGQPASREELLARMRDHIMTVVGHYKGKIKGWDVVNEALADNGSLRKSQWLKIIGDDYLVKAYQFAHEADPDAELYYNEYSMEDGPKRAGAIALVKKLKAAGVPLAGVGVQGHYRLDWPTPEQAGRLIDDLSALGVKVMITELDVSVLPSAASTYAAEVSDHGKADPKLDPYRNGLPEEMQEKLARRYAELFKVFVNHKSQITRVTFWGVTDKGSWLNDWPIRGRVNYPLLFDRQCRPKLAFEHVLSVANQ
jgi:endo-1,4-beta-xylanase